MLNRKKAPAFQELESFPPIQVEEKRLENNVPVYMLHANTQALLRIELIFSAGTWVNPQVNVSSTTAKMMSQGTTNYSSFEIAEFVSKYGAHLGVISTADHIKISLFTLTKYLEEVLPIVKELILNASFPVKELSILQEKMLQGLRLSLEKNTYISSQIFKKALLGENNPYAEELTEKTITSLNRNILEEFAKQYLIGKSFDIVVAGNIPSNLLSVLNTTFGHMFIEESVQKKDFDDKKDFQAVQHIEKEEALQTSIKIGRKIMNRKHEDCFSFVILNEILGGFFGSRLMKNIREEKGLTYGIHSSNIHLLHSNFWLISTDVKKELKDVALTEIYKELEVLQNELVSDQELKIVKNHLLGSFCSSMNTCFDLADRFKVMHYQKLDKEYYNEYISAVKNISSVDLQKIAQQYLNKQDLVQVTVG